VQDNDQVLDFEELLGASRSFAPPPYQEAAARAAAVQAGARTAAVRWRFIARQDAEAPSPPMARILRGGGGRGGATRLKLYLSLLWLARSYNRLERPVFAYPAQQLAALLGLPSPAAAGARRIQEALRWLAKERFVDLDVRPGDATRVHLLDDAGSGDPYRPAGPLAGPAQKRSQKEREQHFYVQLDARFWTEGWIAELSGAAIAMYLACLHEERGRPAEEIWVSPQVGRERYDLSEETRNKGLRELVGWDLLSLRRRPVPAAGFDERFRARNVYMISAGAWARKREASTASATEILGFRQPDL
jgi:hypothetical protein